MGTPDPTFSSLSSAEQHLVRLMQSISHGRVTGLRVRDGQPAFDPPPTVVRIVKLRPGTPPPPAPAAAGREFALRREVLDLLAAIRAMRRGAVERLEVLHGLPTVAELSHPADASPPPTSTRSPAR